jgi:C-methyltransferase-like protein/methyltransferase family protein/putative zinc binding protein
MHTSYPRLAAGTGSSVVVDRCQVCGSTKLDSVLFLGFLPPVNQMRAIGTTPFEQPSYPAGLLYCRNCELVQLGLSVDPAVIFPPSYPYTSGTTRILRDNFAELYRQVKELYGLLPENLIVDIGSNDGTLLSGFKQGGHRVLGIEPTDVGQIARDGGIETLQSYFRSDVAKTVREKYGAARVVTAANCFAHIEDVHNIVEGILTLLDDKGLFISENHYLPSLLDTLQYDTIYHEHLRYYSLHSVKYLLEMHGMEVVHAVRIPTHGGSIRVYSARRGAYPASPAVAEILAREPIGDAMLARLSKFRGDVILTKLRLLALLKNIKEQGGRICGVSAPSRASTLVNYVGLDDGILDYVVEIKGSLKIGKYLPGTLVPVVEESRMFEDQPDYALILSWHIAEELAPKIRSRGFRGTFITPLPEPRLL